MDSTPLVVIAGQVPTLLIGNDAFQEADTVGITRPCTKHNFLVKDVKTLASTIKQAFHIARTGRPGPVVVDLPKDVIAESAEFSYPSKIKLRGYNPTYQGHAGQIKKAFKLLAQAQKPMIYAGGGVILSNAHKELLALAQKMSIPVTNTLMGLGGFPGNHPLFLGMLGMHGTFKANMGITPATFSWPWAPVSTTGSPGRWSPFLPIPGRFTSISIPLRLPKVSRSTSRLWAT
jgi:acetolactate synthase-1/2/3 large subunit